MQTATAKRSGSLPAKQSRLRRRVLNVRLLAVSAIAAAAIGAAGHFWHELQVNRNATALLDRATQLEKNEKWLHAAQTIHRFLQLRPEEFNAKIRLAEDFDCAAVTPREKTRAVELYATAIGLAPERTDLRNRHLDLLLESGDYSAALRYADEMLEIDSDGAPALRVRSLALLAQLQIRGNITPGEVAESFEAAIAKNPDDPELPANLARLYRADIRSTDKADQAMDQLVNRAADNPASWLARYTYRKQFGLPEADEDLDQALRLDADAKHLETRLTAGYRAQQSADWISAERYFKDVMKIDKRDRRGYLGLGLAYSAQGKIKEAIEAWRAGLTNIGGDDLVMLTQIAKADIQLQRWEDAEKTLDQIEQQAQKIFGREQSAWRVTIDSLRAEMFIAKDECRKAIPLLNDALLLRQAGAETEASLTGNAVLYAALGQCHARLAQWDQAATTYQKAADLRPAETSYRLAAAAAWVSAGRIDEASRQYEQGLAGRSGPADAWVAYSQVAFRQQMIALEPNWAEFERILSEAQAHVADTHSAGALALKLLNAEFLLQQRKFEEAFSLLKTLEGEVRGAPELSARLVFDYERIGRPQDADRALGEFEKEPQNGVRAALVWAELLTGRRQFDEAERHLTSALAGELTKDEKASLAYRLAILHLSQGKPDEAQQELETIASADRIDRRAPALLAELALSRGDLPETQKWERRLREVLGEEGALWRFYRAQRLIRESGEAAAGGSKAKQRLLDEAAKLQAEVEELRPNWSAGYLLKARLALLDKQPDIEAAIRAYAHCIQLGETRLEVYQSLIALLYQQNRIGEAATYLNRLRDATELPAEMTTMAMAIDARQGNLSGAIDAARREVEQHPQDAMRRVWLGQLLSRELPAKEIAKKDGFGEAEAQFIRAKQLTPKDLRVWLALLSFYRSADQFDSARKLLLELEESDVVAEKEQSFVLAQGYAFLGDRDQARTLYVKAVKSNSDSINVQLEAARFFLQSSADGELAKQCVDRILELEPNHEAARNLDALLRFSEGGSEVELERIYASLDKTDAPGEPSSASQRLKALMLIRRGGETSRHRALQVLESLVEGESAPTDIDRLLLARLYEAQGQTAAAADQLRALVNRDHASSNHLAAYIDFLLRTEQAAEAGYSLDQLAKLEPEAERWRSATLRARWLKARDEKAKIPALVQDFLQRALAKSNEPAQQASLWLNAGKLYSSLALDSEAESSFRQAVKLEPKTLPTLAIWLANHGKAPDAVDLCMKAAETDQTSQTARTLSGILVLGPLPAELRSAAESLLISAIERHKNDARLLFDVANVRLFHGDNSEAIHLLRRVLQLDPKNIQAMNNLAILLASQPQSYAEAIEYIDRAIALTGLHPELLDSKAWILLCHGDGVGAETLLRDAVSSPPGDARHHFHLALAYQMQSKLNEARNSLQKAINGNLPKNLLMPDELSRLHSLEQALR